MVNDHAFRVLYRRRQHAATKEQHDENPDLFAPPIEQNKKDNRHIVPHNKYLVMKYQSQ